MKSNRKSKTQIHASKPEPPAFLQRMREQIVANEDAERRERSEKRRKERGTGLQSADSDDDPTVVKVNDGDLTEEEYKRMKLELETQYKLDEPSGSKASNKDLDVDALIAVRNTRITKSPVKCQDDKVAQARDPSHQKPSESYKSSKDQGNRRQSTSKSSKTTTNKTLSYGSSDEND